MKTSTLATVEDRATTTSPPPLAPVETRAIEMARIAAETRAHHVVVMDLRQTVDWVDYMVVATGTSRRQMKAVADRIEESMESLGDRKLSRSESDQWIAIDFGDIIMHLFDEQGREYYQLDDYWGEAPRVAWEDPNRPVAAASPAEVADSETEEEAAVLAAEREQARRSAAEAEEADLAAALAESAEFDPDEADADELADGEFADDEFSDEDFENEDMDDEDADGSSVNGRA